MGGLFPAPAALALLAVLGVTAAAPDNPPPGDSVGAIEGETIAISGPMTVDVVNGQIVTVLRSGSDVRVKSGTAHIKLVEGGEIAICGPAHLSVLKSGSALTIALELGTIHAHIEHDPALTVYTPQIQAQPVAIGEGPQDSVVGFDAAGAMCVRTRRGALRLEQQLTGQTVLVPQGGDVFLANGQIDSLRTAPSGRGTSGSPAHCVCGVQLAEAPPPPPEISRLATAEEARSQNQSAKPEPSKIDAKPIQKEEPVYQVFVPPLVFNANAKVQPEVDPKMILVIRRVRVRPTLIFQGKVEGDSLVAQTLAPAASGAPPTGAAQPSSPPPAPKPAPTTVSFFERVRMFVRKLWSGRS